MIQTMGYNFEQGSGHDRIDRIESQTVSGLSQQLAVTIYLNSYQICVICHHRTMSIGYYIAFTRTLHKSLNARRK